MKKLYVPVLGMVAAVLFVAAPADAQTYSYGTTSTSTFKAILNGMNEVPAATTSSTTGEGMFWVRPGGTEIEYALSATGTEVITAGHLHCALVGQNGPVVVSLVVGENGTGTPIFHTSGLITSGSTTPNCTGINGMADLIQAMHDGRIYVNLHSPQHPDGAARGQLMLATTSATTTPATTTPATTTPATTTPATTTPPTPTPPTAPTPPTPPTLPLINDLRSDIQELLQQLRALEHELRQLLTRVWRL